MGLIQRALSLIKGATPRQGPPFQFQVGSPWLQPIERSTEGYLRAYGEMGWLYACVSRIASAVGDCQWHVYQMRNGERKELLSHPLIDLLNFVNPFQTGEELFEASQQYLDLIGECFWVVNRNRAGLPGEIWVAPPQNMKVVPSREKFISGYLYGTGRDAVPFEVEDVIHLKYPNPINPYRGIGPAQSIALEIDTDRYAGEWNRNFFYNDATPGTILIYPGTVSDDEYQRLREQWESRHRGAERAHKVAILSGEAKVERTMLSQQDMGFVEMRKMNRDAILGAFGIPLSVLGIVENVNRANAEAGEYTFGRWVLRPRLTRWREKLNEQLCPMFGEGLELDYDDPVPENRELIISEAERAVKAGIMTRNEARLKLGLDSLEGEDVFVLPAAPVLAMAEIPERKRLLLPSVHLREEKAIGHSNSVTEWKTAIASREARFRKEMERLFEEQEESILSRLQSLGASRKGIEWKQSAEELERVFDVEAAAAAALAIGRPIITAVLREAGEAAVRGYNLGIDFSLRNPLVERWLGDRLKTFSKDITDTTKEAISEQLKEAHRLGEGIPQMQKRVEGYFDQQGPMRAERIARTETVFASNRGAIEAYRQSGVVDEWEWLVAFDPCPICEPYAGKRFGLDAPHPPFLHPNCLLPDIRVEASHIVAGSRAFYRGKAIELRTENGNRLAVTPNHMILTPAGFVKAKALRQGDYIICSLDGERIISSIDPDNYYRPTPIADIWNSLMVKQGMVRATMPVAPVDFYGDAGVFEGDIDIICADSLLLDDVTHPSRCEHRDHHIFYHRDAQPPSFTSLGSSLPFSNRMMSPTGSNMRSGGKALALLERKTSHAQKIGLAAVARDYPRLKETAADDIPVYLELSRQFQLRFASLIAPEKVVQIREFDFSGHVYDLQSLEQLYSANGIVVKNCRCASAGIVREEGKTLETRCPVCKRFLGMGLKGEAFCPKCNHLTKIN